MDCPTCHQRIPEPRPLLDASPDDHKAARAVRAVLNELVGHEVTRSRVAELVEARLTALGYLDARWVSERVVAYVLGG